jgi:predicted N-acetyltransferase YhbS
MDIRLRPGKADDAQACGVIEYEAFKAIADTHNYPPDFPSVQVATDVVSMLLNHPGFYSVVAEVDGRIVGSNFLDERSTIAGLGPITVSPSMQDSRIGRRLMGDVLDRAADRKFAGVRLVQAAYHRRSLALYAKLGFDVREMLSGMQGTPLRVPIPGHAIRAGTQADAAACNRLCLRVHGFDRAGEVADAIKQGTLRVVEHDARISGYTAGLGWFTHTLGESNNDLKALIGSATEYTGPGFLLPTRNAELFRWCLTHGLRVVQQMTLMTIGLYNEPQGAYLPGVLY